jgi:excisionase family DNA binding protein
MDPLLYSYANTMQQLSIGLTTLYKLIDTGQLTRVHIGRRSLITAESLEAYVNSLKATPEAAPVKTRPRQKAPR